MDSGCRKLTAAWVREAAQKSHDVETCDFFEGLERAAADAVRLWCINYVQAFYIRLTRQSEKWHCFL